MEIFAYKLGLPAKDKITGFEGTIIARAEHLTGCNTYGLKPPVDKDGKLQQAEWFDEGCIEILPDKKIIEKDTVKAKDKGGPLSENPLV